MSDLTDHTALEPLSSNQKTGNYSPELQPAEKQPYHPPQIRKYDQLDYFTAYNPH